MARPDVLAARAQGVLYVVTGVWPLVSMRSFEWVTGPKVERWLVRTVGLLVTVIGAVLLHADDEELRSEPLRALGIGSALSLAAVDTVSVATGRIRRVYLLDALAEIVLAAGWLVRPSGQGLRR